jgi:hypothetical protein
VFRKSIDGLVITHVWKNTVYKEVKESLNRPSVAQRVPGGLGSQIS